MNNTPTPELVALLPELPEPFEIEWPQLHSHALGCGVEDRGLTNRYECAEYGWQDGVDRAAECVPEQVYTADQMREYAVAAIEATRAATVPQGVSDSDRDAAALRFWRNQFIGARTGYFRELDGMDYEQARAHAEARANELEEVLFDAMDRLENKDAATTPPPAELGEES